MFDRRDQPRAEDAGANFMFKKFFDHEPGWHSNDPEIVEAQRFWSRLGKFTRPLETCTSRTSGRNGTIRIVASAMVATIFVGLFLWWVRDSTEQPWRTFKTGHGRQQVVVMNDGSTISLAAETRVDVRYEKKTRRLRLVSGQAFFDVAPDPDRPFVVKSRSGAITAVGTAFNIRLRHDVEVTVVKGIVDIDVVREAAKESGTTIARASRGERITYGQRHRNGALVVYVNRQAGVDVDAATAWTRGKLHFDGEPLAEAIREVNTYSSKRLVLKDPASASMPVYGVLDQGDVEGLIVLVNDKRILSAEPQRRR